MPKTTACSACGKAVYRSPTSRPEIICRECRRKNPAPAKSYPKKTVAALCEECGCEFQSRRNGQSSTGWTRYCSRACAAKAQCVHEGSYGAGRVARAVAASRRRRLLLNAAPWDGIADSAILDRDHWTCRIPVCLYGSRRISKSRKYPDGRSASVDHILPLSLGGDDTQYNKRAAHLSCNVARGNQTDEQMPLAFGADMQSTTRFHVRPTRAYRDCEVCGERVGRTQQCQLHKPVAWCRYCQRVIPNAATHWTLHAECRAVECADRKAKRAEAERQRLNGCAADGCTMNGSFGQGYCAPHFHRFKRYGDVFSDIPIAGDRTMRVRVNQLIMARIAGQTADTAVSHSLTT